MDIQDFSIPAVTAVISVISSYAIMRQEVATMKENQKEISKKLAEECVTREGCRIRHEYIERDMREIKEKLATIRKGQEDQQAILLQILDKTP